MIKSNTAAHSTIVTKPAQSPVPVINKRQPQHSDPRPSTAPGLGVCEWSPEGLYDKSVSLILITDEILKLVKKKLN